MELGDSSNFSQIELNGFIFNFILVIFFILLGILIFFLIKKLIRRLAHNSSYFDNIVFLVKLPKEKPEDNKKEFTAQEIKEEIAKGETIFASIGGLRAQRGLRARLLGRNDIYSFEIVAHKGRIAYFVISPRKMARYIEQQINAYYPEASIEEVEDYNIFSPNNKILSAYLKTNRSFALPLKTYTKSEVDPLSSLINTMSKLDHNDSIAVQYVLRSAYGSWHKRVRKIVKHIHEESSVSDGLRKKSSAKFFSYANQFLSLNKKKNDLSDTEAIKKLSAVEEEMVKSIEEKNLKAGLDVNLRIIVSSEKLETAKLYLENISNTFSEYNNYSYGNSFSRPKQKKQSEQIKDYIYRRFREKNSFLLSTEELASIFHFPLKNTETPNILWLKAKSAPAPTEIPDSGLLLGENHYRGEKKKIMIRQADRRRHTYIIGKSGVGKSVLLTNMAVQDIINGEGVCVLDPHGDLIEDILARVPPERAEDVVIFSPADTERPLALNLLEYDPNYPEQKSFVINEMIGIFDKLYDLKQTGGPMFEQYMRNALLLIMDDPETGSTLMEVPKVLADEEFRKLKLSRCKNKTVVDFWNNEAEKAGGEAALANIVPYITSKLTSFISNDMMRPIIGQQESSFSFRDLMDKQKILLIDLPKGVVGEMNAYLLGMIVVGKILMAALSRSDMKTEDRKDFYLYIDEFQNFTTDSISQILSEARKYALNLIVAHQYIGQLSKNNDTSIKDAVFGNVGTIISFKIGTEDAEFLEKEFSPVFNVFDLINIDKGTAYIKLLVDNSSLRPFSLRTTWPILGEAREEMSKNIRSLSRLKYAKDKNIIEAEIEKRTRINP